MLQLMQSLGLLGTNVRSQPMHRSTERTNHIFSGTTPENVSGVVPLSK